MKVFIVCFVIFLCSQFVIIPIANSQALPVPFRIRCDLLLNETEREQKSISISSQQPRFTWQVDSAIKKVTAYRILVSSSANRVNQNNGDVWDSKRSIADHQSVLYNGNSLEPGITYFWKVQIWNEKGNPTPFSEVKSFTICSTDSTDSFSHYPLTTEVQLPVYRSKRTDGTYFFDFGKDALAQLHLDVTSEREDSIWLDVGEAIAEKDMISKKPGQNIRYLRMPIFVQKGDQEFNLEWPINEKRNSRNPIMMPDDIGEVYPFRYVSIENHNGIISAASVKRKMVFYPFDDLASDFVSSDTVLNQVWDLCKYSIKATSFTGYYVDGDRERIPYEADALINQLSHYAVDAEYSIARRTMEYLLFHPTWPTEWTLQNVLIAWNDYLYTGDDAFLKKYYPELQKKILLPLAGNNGLISTRTNKQTDDFLKAIHNIHDFDRRRGLHDIVDWPQNVDFIGNEKEYKGETDGFVYNTYNAVINAFYYRNLIIMQKIAKALHKNVEAEFYKSTSKKVFLAFQKIFRDPNSGLIRDGDSTEHTSLHANLFALAFGLIPDADQQAVIHFIKSRKMACSVYGSQFLLDALYDSDQGDYALELMRATTQRSWYNMIRSGSTITLEAWDKLYKPNLDWSHAWGAAPANLIVRKLMGVEPITPGGEVIQIKPQPGNLSFAHLKTTMLRGVVSVSYRKNSIMNEMEVIIPGGTIAHVYMPIKDSKAILYMNELPVKMKPIHGYYVIKNQSAGKYTFMTK